MDGTQESMMDTDAVDLGGVQCELCGSTQFYNEMGFYFCSVCNTQSQDAREFISDEQMRDGVQTNTTVGRLRGEGSKKFRKTIIISRYEVFNYVLREMLRKLVEIGFPSTVRGKAFQLWIAYLKRRRIIHVLNEENNDKFEVSLRPDEGSIKKFYKTQEFTRRRKANYLRVYGSYVSGKLSREHFEKKKLMMSKMNSSNWQVDEDGNPIISAMQAKRQKTMSKRKAMEAEYRSQLAAEGTDEGIGDASNNVQSGGNDGSAFANSPTRNRRVTFATNNNANPKPAKIRLYRSKAKKLILRAINFKSKERTRFNPTAPAKTIVTQTLKPEVFSLKTLYALVFIALREVGCSVVYTDLLRMAFDGTLTLKSVTQFFSEEEQNSVSGYCDALVAKNVAAELYVHAESIENLILYLGIKEFRYPTIAEVLPKFIDDLSLPLEFECFVKEVDRYFSWETLRQTSYMNKSYFTLRPLIEIHTLVLILVALKLLFGLDDVTERYASQFARTVNTIIDTTAKKRPGLSVNKDFVKLFVVEDWIHHLRHKREVVKAELFSTECYNPFQKPSVARIHNFGKVFGGHKAISMHVLGTAVESVPKQNALKLRDLFRGFADKNDEDAHQAPMYIAASLSHEDIVRTYIESHPNVNEPSFSLEPLKKDFTKTRIDFVFNPDKYRLMLKKSSYDIKVIPGHANPSNVPKRPNTIPLFQPYVKFDEQSRIPEERSHSVEFLIKAFAGVITGIHTRVDHVEAILERCVFILAREFCARHSVAHIPVEAYSESDTEAEEIEETIRAKIDRITGRDKAPLPLYDLEEENQNVQNGLPKDIIDQAAQDMKQTIQRIKASEQRRKEVEIDRILFTLRLAIGTYDENEVFEESSSSSSDGEIVDREFAPRQKKRRRSSNAVDGSRKTSTTSATNTNDIGTGPGPEESQVGDNNIQIRNEDQQQENRDEPMSISEDDTSIRSVSVMEESRDQEVILLQQQQTAQQDAGNTSSTVIDIDTTGTSMQAEAFEPNRGQTLTERNDLNESELLDV